MARKKVFKNSVGKKKATASKPLFDFFSIDFFYNNFTYLILLCFLMLAYIGNVNYAARQNMALKDNQSELEELRWEYTTTSSKIMRSSKQSELLKMVKPSGLAQIDAPIYKIDKQ